MSVLPGFGGQSFIPEVLDKVSGLVQWLKNNNRNIEIQIDGGINAETASLAISSGVTNLVAGSFILMSKDYSETINSLRKD